MIGAGAVGCFVGGMLAAGGEDVTFVARERGKAELASTGLTCTSLEGASVRVPKERIVVTADPRALEDRDVVLCCVKSAQTREVGTMLARLISPQAMVISLQNGLRNADALRRELGERPVLGGIVGFNVVPTGGGSFRQATEGALIFEASRDARIDRLSRALRTCGVEVELVDDVRAHQWAKLVMNLNNAVSALSGAPSRDLVFVSGYRRIVAALVAEAVSVMRAAKVRPAKLRGIPVFMLPTLLRLPTPLVKLVARAQLRIDPDARSSMWEDLARGRSTEVDELNGEIVRLAESCGAEAPLNRRLVALVHEVEAKGGGSPKLAPDALWSAISASPRSSTHGSLST